MQPGNFAVCEIPLFLDNTHTNVISLERQLDD